MKAKSEYRRLPTGEITRSLRRYSAAWRRLASPFEQLMGWKLLSFDPGMSFSRGPCRRSQEISVDIAMLVYKLSKGQQYKA